MASTILRHLGSASARRYLLNSVATAVSPAASTLERSSQAYAREATRARWGRPDSGFWACTHFSTQPSPKENEDVRTGSQEDVSTSGSSGQTATRGQGSTDAAGGDSGAESRAGGAGSADSPGDGTAPGGGAAPAEPQALNKVAEAARQAASFATGVAGELFKRTPLAWGGSTSSSSGGSSGANGGASAAGQESESADGQRSKGGGGSTFERMRSAFKSPESLGRIVQTVRSEVAAAVLPTTNLPSVMRKVQIDDSIELRPGDGPSQLMAVKQEQTYWQKAQEIFGNSPFYKTLRNRLGGSAAARKVQEFSDDVRERIETSDSDVVNRMVDMRASLMAENEQAITYREIKTRNPGFDMPTFLRAIRNDIPIVIKAYLEGKEDVLKEYCSDSMVERLMGIYRAGKMQGQIHDPTILEYSDVDLVDMKMQDGAAVLILHFSCQQINCYRDNYGNVVSGAPDEVNRMYYYWAVQQDGHGVVTRDGKFIPPRWMLTEMLLRGQIHLL